MKKVLLTGDRLTGPLHLGHYFGSLLNRKALEQEYETYIMAADVQSLTDNWEHPDKVRKALMEVTADNLALGLDPEKTTFFIQSQIPQIAELTVFYSNLVTVNTLKRNPTVKAEIAQKTELFGQEGEGVTYGFLGYPISQAADITVVRASAVPVGSDQLPVIEQTREVIEKFHRIYGKKIFPLPQPILSKGHRILGLDGNAKMSKSLNNAVYLKDSPEETIEKIKGATTDSESVVGYDPEKRPGISNLVLIYSLIHDLDPNEAVKELAGVNYSAFKMRLAEDVNTHLAPLRERRAEIATKPDAIRDILAAGTKRTLPRTEETMRLVREAMRIDY